MGPLPLEHDASGSPAVKENKSKTQVTDAFLAGEAQGLVLRGKSRGCSKAGLPTPGKSSGQRTTDSGTAQVQ